MYTLVKRTDNEHHNMRILKFLDERKGMHPIYIWSQTTLGGELAFH